jgi:hypothetical protein
MNTNSTLRSLLAKKPYVPVRIEMVDGQVFHVPHPEFIALPPATTDRLNPYFLVWRKDGSGAHVNPTLVARIVPDTGRGKVRHQAKP